MKAVAGIADPRSLKVLLAGDTGVIEPRLHLGFVTNRLFCYELRRSAEGRSRENALLLATANKPRTNSEQSLVRPQAITLNLHRNGALASSFGLTQFKKLDAGKNRVKSSFCQGIVPFLRRMPGVHRMDQFQAA